MRIIKEIYYAWKYRRFNPKWSFIEWVIYRLYKKYIYPKFGIGED